MRYGSYRARLAERQEREQLSAEARDDTKGPDPLVSRIACNIVSHAPYKLLLFCDVCLHTGISAQVPIMHFELSKLRYIYIYIYIYTYIFFCGSSSSWDMQISRDFRPTKYVTKYRKTR